MNQILLQDDITAKDYLTALLQAYPYTIDYDIVYTLLNKTTYPHPSLLAFLRYFAKIPKYHIGKQDKENPALTTLAKRMSDLHQRYESVLSIHLFMFDASIYIKKYTFHNPYAHLPLTKIPFLHQVHLHKPLLFQTPIACPITIQHKTHFLYKDVSLHAQQFIALHIRIVDKTGIIFMPRTQLGSLIALSQLFQCEKPTAQQDFFILCGITANQNDASYYYDATNNLYIGYLGGDASMSAFPLITKMIQTIYQTICRDKQDLPVDGFMITIQSEQNPIGIVFCGNDQDGVHELAYALEKIKQKYQAFHIESVFEQSGTLHFLDNDISATGTQVGTLVPVKLLDHAYLLSHLHQGMWLNPDGEAMLLTHQVAFRQTKTFHKVTMFLCVSEDTTINGIRPFANLLAAKHYCDPLFQKAHHLTDHDKPDDLLHHFLDIMYLNNIMNGEIYVGGTTSEARMHSAIQSLEVLFDYLRQANRLTIDSTNTGL